MIINRNLLEGKSFAPEKLCTALFDTGRRKITMKRHAAGCMCQAYIHKQLVPERPRISHRRLQIAHVWLGKYNFVNMKRKNNFKHNKRNQIFEKKFFLKDVIFF